MSKKSGNHSNQYFVLDPTHTDPARLKREREAGRALKQSSWWQQKIQAGQCHYCGKHFKTSELTLDHIVPLARGGTSTRGNCVPACKPCNASKKLSTPAEDAFAQLERERAERAGSTDQQESDEPQGDKE